MESNRHDRDRLDAPAAARIAVDGAGGDRGPSAVLDALELLDEPTEIRLVVAGEQVAAARQRRFPASVAIVEAGSVVPMDADPVDAAADRSTTLYRACSLVGTEAEAVVTSGNTGAAVLAATMAMGRVRGVAHPALAVTINQPDGGRTLLLDAGATTTCPPAWLCQFGHLGRTYASALLERDDITVALLSNGHEDGKGDKVRNEAHERLADVNGYIGRIEGHDLLKTDVDVIVTDGFTGNVALKTFEGTTEVVARLVIAEACRLTGTDLVAPLVGHVEDHLWGDSAGVILGLRGLCLITHGAAVPADIARSIQQAARLLRGGWPTRLNELADGMRTAEAAQASMVDLSETGAEM